MNRLALGTLLGITFGVLDMILTVLGDHPGNTSALLQAFFSRFAVGFLGTNVSFPFHPVLGGALVGLLLSIPDAIALQSYAGILASGIAFGALVGIAAKRWGE